MDRRAFLASLAAAFAWPKGLRFHRAAFAYTPPLPERFVIPGVYVVNPMTRTSTARLMEFRKLENGMLWPPRIDEGLYQNCTKPSFPALDGPTCGGT